MGLNDRDVEGWIFNPIRIGNLLFLPEGGSQNGINEPSPSPPPVFFGQFHGFIHCRRNRCPRQKQDLIEPEAQDIDDVKLYFLKGKF